EVGALVKESLPQRFRVAGNEETMSLDLQPLIFILLDAKPVATALVLPLGIVRIGTADRHIDPAIGQPATQVGEDRGTAARIGEEEVGDYQKSPASLIRRGNHAC